MLFGLSRCGIDPLEPLPLIRRPVLFVAAFEFVPF